MTHDPGASRPASALWVRPGHVFVQQVGNAWIVLNARTGMYLELNEVSFRIWEALTRETSMEEALRTLLDEFEVKRGALEAAILAVIPELEENGLLERGNG